MVLLIFIAFIKLNIIYMLYCFIGEYNRNNCPSRAFQSACPELLLPSRMLCCCRPSPGFLSFLPSEQTQWLSESNCRISAAQCTRALMRLPKSSQQGLQYPAPSAWMRCHE